MHRFLVLGATLVVVLALSGVAAAWSWPADGEVLRTFELGSDTYAAGQHRGIDVAGAPGSPVRAPAAGIVTFAGSVPTHGRGVTILTADGYSVTLFHLESVEVVKGDAVAEGATVGTMGSSGDAEHSVPTVHLGIRVAERSDGYVDPLGFLPPRPVAQPVSPPAATVPAPVAAPAPAPTAPPPPVQPPAPTPPATPVPPPSPPAVVPAPPVVVPASPAVVPAPPAAATPPVAPPVGVSPAVTATAPDPSRGSVPAPASSPEASPSETPVGAELSPAGAGEDNIVLGVSQPGRSALSVPTLARHEQVGPVTAGAAPPAHVHGAGSSHGSANGRGGPSRPATAGAGVGERAVRPAADGLVVRSAVESVGGRGAVGPSARDERVLRPVVRPSHQPLREPSVPGGGR